MTSCDMHCTLDYDFIDPNSIQKLLDLIPSTLKWKLMERAPLNTWIHKDGRLVLLGDSCHPMLVSVLHIGVCLLKIP